MSDIKHGHVITFKGRPTILELTRALNLVEKLYGQYTKVDITGIDSADPELVETFFSLESES